MDDHIILSEAKIAIVGLGLMGGSLAIALKSKAAMVLGVDIDLETVAFAQKNEIVDFASTKSEDILPKADVIILAVPVCSILQVIHTLPSRCPDGAIVMDIGSTKREILSALSHLPKQFDPIGCHPMCGKENLTIHNADSQMFQDAPFAITPLERTSENAQSFACQLAEAIGTKYLLIDAETHDDWTAATSHLPFLISMALAHSTPEEVTPLVGPGFRSTVRLAGTPASMMLDILRTNSDNVLKHCKNYLSTLTEIAKLIEDSEFDQLTSMIDTGKTRKEFFSTRGKH